MMAATVLCQGAPSLNLRARSTVPFQSQPLRVARLSARRVVRVAAEEKKEAEVQTEPAAQEGTFYNDERPLKPKDDLSPEFKQRLKQEYLSLGGSPNTPMGSNYFLWIIVIVSVLAVLSWALGYI